MTTYTPEIGDKVVSIYGLVCPYSDAVRYVGKAVNPENRLAQHLTETRRKTPLYDWIGSLRKNGSAPRLVVLAVCSKDKWQDAEIEMILRHRKMGKLLNVADGGDQPKASLKTLQANGRATAKAVHGDPSRRRLWELKRSLNAALKKGFVSKSTMEKMKAAANKYPKMCGEWAAIV